MANIKTNYGAKYTTISSALTFSQLQGKTNTKNAVIISTPDIDGATSPCVGIGVTDNEGQFMPLSYSFDTSVFKYDDNINTVSLTDVYKHNLEVLAYILSTDERFNIKFYSDISERIIKTFKYEDNGYFRYYALNNVTLICGSNIYNDIVSCDSNFSITQIDRHIDEDDTYSYITKYTVRPYRYGSYSEAITVTTQIGTTFTTPFNYISMTSLPKSQQIEENCYVFVADVNKLLEITPYVTLNELLGGIETCIEKHIPKKYDVNSKSLYLYYYKVRNRNAKFTPVTVQDAIDLSQNSVLYTSDDLFDIWNDVSRYGMYNNSTTEKYNNQDRHIIMLVPDNYITNEYLTFNKTATTEQITIGTFVDSGFTITDTVKNTAKVNGTTAAPTKTVYRIFYYTLGVKGYPTDMTDYLDEKELTAQIQTPFVKILEPEPEKPKSYTVTFFNGTLLVYSVTGEANQTFNLPNTPTKTGYSFRGWGTSTGSVVYRPIATQFTIGTKNANYYALWTKNTTPTVMPSTVMPSTVIPTTTIPTTTAPTTTVPTTMSPSPTPTEP